MTTTTVPAAASTSLLLQHPNVTCIKTFAESPGLKTIPSNYAFTGENDVVSVSDDSLPVIDFSLLTSDDPNLHSKALQDLGKACQDWGFFMLVNHGMPEALRKTMIDGCREFFELPDVVKKEFERKDVLDPIRCGTSFNKEKENVFFWRDFLKVFVHPEFHFPNKPAGLSEIAFEYVKKIRELVREVLGGISLSLGREKCYIEKAMNLQSGLQVFIANLYPPCPQPELAMGMPPHSDHGLLSLLTQNDIGGLQIHRNGEWFNVNALPGAFLVNTGDHLEILSNGKYKSVMHRAAVNSNATRISVVVVTGPSLETSVSPASELVDAENGRLPAYAPMKYRDYLEKQQANKLDGKSCLDLVRTTNQKE